MEINGQTKLLGVIGNPIAHTLSPVIHNTLAKLLSDNLVYVPFLVEDRIEDAIKGAYALHIQGMNITVPYKTEVIPYLQGIDRSAQMIGAVNTLVRTQNGYQGYNTDLPGLYRALQSEGISVEGQKVIILGAGGAARAAAFMCALYHAESIYILNRTLQHAKCIADEIKEKINEANVYAMETKDFMQIPGSDYLVLQATKAGLKPDVLSTPISDERFFDKVSVVYDLVYTPFLTKFMEMANMHGIKAYNGLSMLLYQGIYAYELFCDTSVPEDTVKEVYEKLKGKCSE